MPTRSQEWLHRPPSQDGLHPGHRHRRLPAILSGVPRLVIAAMVLGLAGVSVAALPAPPAGAATQTVTNCNVSGTGSLPQAVLNATSGDTIAFALSPPCPVLSLKDTIDLAANVTIDGPGTTILTLDEVDGDRADFVVPTGVTATISGLTIDGGGGIDNSGTLTLNGTTLSASGSTTSGGIVNSGTLAVTDSTLSGNGVASAAGAGGGGIENLGGRVTVTDSTLSDNTASAGADGGGIDNDAGTVTITGSTLSGNSASEGSGGGVHNAGGGTLTIDTSTLADNSAVDGTGGAIENDSGTVTVADSTLLRNTAFYSLGGGGIFNASSATITNSTLVANGAIIGGDGGAVYNSGTLSITGSTLDRNTSADDGGGIFVKGGTVTVASTILAASKKGNCFGTITDAGFNLADDATCGLTAATDITDLPAGLDATGLATNGGPTRTVGLETGSPAIGAVSTATLCSTPDQRGVTRPTPCDIGAVELVLPPQIITSSATATARVDSPFSFTVTTSGTPVPTVKRTGDLPKHLTLADNDNGTATLSGIPVKIGAYHLTFKATFGKHAARTVATQAFILNVVAKT